MNSEQTKVPTSELRSCGHTIISRDDAECTICAGTSFHMSPDEFLRHADDAVKWVANYHSNVESFPVLSTVLPGETRSQLPTLPPDKGESFSEMLSDMDDVVLPGITHWQSPNFYAYFPSNISGPSILGELISAGISVQGMLWKTSPACTEIEAHVLDWLVHAMGLPSHYLSSAEGGGVIQDSASSAVLCALIAAREKATDGRVNKEGCSQPLVAYASSQTHSSVEKAIRIAGVGSDNLRSIPVDDNFAMRPDLLAVQIRRDLDAGLIPFFACGTVGTTSSNAMDPIRSIGELCREYGLWYHVDAAMSGSAALCPEFRYLFDGLELADSYNFNPHKWMMTNFDCSCLFVRDRRTLIESLSINPEYLHTEEYASGEVFDYRDWQVPLGRRFRALKLWFVLRHYGLDGLRYHVRYHVDVCQTLAQWIDSHPDFELVVPPVLNLLCFALKSGGGDTRRLLDAVNTSGKAYMTHTVLDGTFVIRWCVGNARTTFNHVAETWQTVRTLANTS